MIEINLLPEQLRKKESVKIALPEIPIKKTIFVALGAIFGLQALFTLFTVFLGFQEASYTRQIQALQDTNKEITRQKSETISIHNRLKDARAATSRKFYWSSLLNALSNSMTKGVWLRAFYVSDMEPKSNTSSKPADPAPTSDKKTTKDKFLIIEGSAVGAGQETAFIGKFLKQLKDNPMFTNLFQDIKPSNINQRRIKEYDVYDFMIICRFRKDKI